MDDRLVRVRRALAEAPVDLLVERLGEELGKLFGVTDVELFHVDYRMRALLPLHGGAACTGAHEPQWRCFDHQTEVVTEGIGYLPVGMRGGHYGVLRLAPYPPDQQSRAELAEAATMLGHELAAAAGSTDRYTVAARSQRLTLAAEMQWELLPGRSRSGPSFELAGQLEPAYAVRGDSFDWADDGERLWLSVINGMGEGVLAATLTALATHALRNARRGGLSLADQAALADQAVYACHRGEQHVAALLLDVDLRAGVVTAIDAGSPRLFLLRDGEVIDQRLEAQCPLGMFEGTIFQTQRFTLLPGDRLVVVSDGVTEAAAGSDRYGDATLARVLRRTRSMAPLAAVRSMLGDLRAFISSDPVDDAVVVCLDWTGPDGRL